VQVDILNTEAHNTRLADTLKLLDAELTEKVGGSTLQEHDASMHAQRTAW
jgi:hypothetical protein